MCALSLHEIPKLKDWVGHTIKTPLKFRKAVFFPDSLTEINHFGLNILSFVSPDAYMNLEQLSPVLSFREEKLKIYSHKRARRGT